MVRTWSYYPPRNTYTLKPTFVHIVTYIGNAERCASNISTHSQNPIQNWDSKIKIPSEIFHHYTIHTDKNLKAPKHNSNTHTFHDFYSLVMFFAVVFAKKITI